MEPESTSDTGFDLDTSVNDIGSSLGFDTPDVEPSQGDLSLETTPTEASTDAVTPPAARQPPKSWAKETHELWGKTDPAVQEYIEKREKDFLDGLEQYKGDSTYAKQFKEIITPYKAMLASQNISETDAIKTLLNFNYRLTQGTPQDRKTAFEDIGRELGFLAAPEGETLDPAIASLQKEVKELRSGLTQRQQAELNAARADAERQITAFAADPANAHYEDVVDDMTVFVNSGLDLKAAYEKAVWANPVTRQKEQARIQTETEAKLKEKAKTEADAARKATSTNMRGVDSRKAPTEPLGSMEDTMRDTLKRIKERAH